MLLPPAEGWEFQEEFGLVLGLVPRIVLASILAFWAGEFANSYVLARMKVKMEGRRLWMRTIGSTVVGQGVDTLLSALIAFVGLVPFGVIVASVVSGYLFKVVYEIAVTPVTYMAVNKLKKLEGVDIYDRDTDFNPFVLGRPE